MLHIGDMYLLLDESPAPLPRSTDCMYDVIYGGRGSLLGYKPPTGSIKSQIMDRNQAKPDATMVQ